MGANRCGFLAIAVLLLAAMPAHAASGEEKYWAAVIRQKPYPGIRFSSGLAVCDEELRDGRWLSRYWLSTGQIKPEFHLEEERRMMDMLPIDAFGLSIDVQYLAGICRLAGAQKPQLL